MRNDSRSGRLSSHGFSAVVAVVTLVVLSSIVLGGWYVWRNNHSGQGVEEPNPTSSQAGQKKQDSDNEKSSDPYKGWSSHANDTYGIEFRYPADWKVEQFPTGSPSSALKDEYAIILELKEEFRYNETVEIAILGQDLEATVAWYDRYYAQSTLNDVTKTHSELKGKRSVQYSVVNSGEESRLYLFEVSGKTYAFSSLGNSQLGTDYWDKFGRFFDSLRLE